MKKRLIIIMIISIAFCLLTGFLGGILTRMDNFVWYNSLKKGTLNPPNYIFPIAWTTLYVLMGISISIIINSFIQAKKDNDITIRSLSFKSIIYFIVIIIMNLLWTLLFFVLKIPFISLIEIIILDITIFITVKQFYKVSKISSFLMVPLLIWSLFATYLTLSVVLLN